MESMVAFAMGDDIIDCFIMQENVPPEWGNEFHAIKWPASALKEFAHAQSEWDY